MSRSELLQLMAAQIFAGMASNPMKNVPGVDPVKARAESAVKAAMAIADAVARVTAPANQDPG